MTVEEKIKLIMSMIKLFIAIIVLIILFCLDIFYLILILKEMFKNRNSIYILYILIESKYLYYWSVGFILMFIPILCNESDGLMSLFLKLGLALSLLVPVYYIIA